MAVTDLPITTSNALNHSELIFMFDIYLSPAHPTGREMEGMLAALATNWLAPGGPTVAAFERELARATGSGPVAVLSSGTAALHLALVLLGIQPGDEVLCQSLTFVATANAIQYVKATPVFIDSEPTTWNMCPDALEAALRDRLARGKRPKAVLVVDLFGMPARYNELLAVCNRYHVPMLEDAAEALGSTYGGKACGTFGVAGVWSFNGNKIITTTGGGALTSASATLVERARFLAGQAREPVAHYEHHETGFTYRLSNIVAGFGQAQLPALAERVSQRRAIFQHYQRLLGHLPGIGFQPEPADSRSNRWLTALTIDPRLTSGPTPDKLRTALLRERIEARPVWKPMHRQPLFAHCPAYLNGLSDRLFATGLCLPSGSAMTAEQCERIAAVISRCWRS